MWNAEKADNSSFNWENDRYILYSNKSLQSFEAGNTKKK